MYDKWSLLSSLWTNMLQIHSRRTAKMCLPWADAFLVSRFPILLRGLTGGQWDEGVIFSSRKVKLRDYNESSWWSWTHWSQKHQLWKQTHPMLFIIQILLLSVKYYCDLYFSTSRVRQLIFFFWWQCHLIFYFSYHVYIFYIVKKKAFWGRTDLQN